MVEEVILVAVSSPPPTQNDAALPSPSSPPPPPFITEAESATQNSLVLQEDYQQPTNDFDDKSAPVETGGELVLSKTQPPQPQQQQPSQPLLEEQKKEFIEIGDCVTVDIGVDVVLTSMIQQSSTLHHQQQQQHNMDLDDANAASAASQKQQDAKRVLFDDASVEELLQQQPIENAVHVTMCKSNLLSFNFETSLVRDESKLAGIIIKSLPEYVNSKSDIELEYQGESIEGVFSGADKHHVCGQPIDDINQNRLMRGLVYYVRELSSSEDEEERATAIILCWTDDAASTSEIFLERVSICEYLRLMEDGYVLCYV